jgi:hypothetical protein
VVQPVKPKGLIGSQKQETRIAGLVGGRRTPGSGNGIRKNDVRTADLSLEMKYTGAKQYTLKAADLEQGMKHALLDGREFGFGIELNKKNYVVLSEDYFLSLIEGE